MELPDEFDEITVAILGNANSGKSSLVGILTDKNLLKTKQSYLECLDDGNGKSRSKILQFDHERSTGRTSSITYRHMCLDKRVVSFVDLAGHEAYLKTTITGVTSSYPDFALVCIEKSITSITKEHIGILVNLGIPFLVVFNKIDIIPDHILNNNIQTITRILARCKKQCLELSENKQNKNIQDKNVTYYIRSSNKTGKNIPLIINILNDLKLREKKL